jgi:hypothetical protein
VEQLAKVLTDADGITHLRGTSSPLCGHLCITNAESEGVMTCPHCAAIALRAMELVTKAEKREWRKL